MQNATEDGIICDFCKSSFQIDFTYYSVDGEEYKFDSNKNINVKSGKNFSYDMCVGCYEIWKEKCLKHISDAKISKVKCDMCDKFYDSCSYYKIILTRLDVSVNNKRPKSEQGILSKNRDIDYNIASCCIDKMVFKKIKSLKDNKWSGGSDIIIDGI